MQRVVVLGGYGAFGARVCERLATAVDLELIIAGRSPQRAKAFAEGLALKAGARVVSAAMDAATVTASELQQIQPQLLINASGPFQAQDYRVARACIDADVHYADLADARGFVSGIATLDAAAKRAGVLVVSGASTVPAISAAVVDELAPQFASLETVAIVVAPGNSFDPGVATTQSILGTLGRPFPASRTGAARTAYGWQGLRRQHIPGLGGRWVGACDAPDRELFPLRYPGLGRADVFAALEVGAMHLGLWGLSWLVRAGAVRDPERLAAPLLAAKRALRFMGSDVGGMAVLLEGKDRQDRRKRMQWSLVARRGHGPFIPATPSVILAKRLLAGTLSIRGAMPCLGLFALADVMAEIADLDIEAQVQ